MALVLRQTQKSRDLYANIMDDTRVKNRRSDRLQRYDLHKRHKTPSTGSQVKHHGHARTHARTHTHKEQQPLPTYSNDGTLTGK